MRDMATQFHKGREIEVRISNSVSYDPLLNGLPAGWRKAKIVANEFGHTDRFWVEFSDGTRGVFGTEHIRVTEPAESQPKMTNNHPNRNKRKKAGRQWIVDALEDDCAGLLEGIKSLYNCREVSVDCDGDIWIADPQPGRWLDEDELAHIGRELLVGGYI